MSSSDALLLFAGSLAYVGYVRAASGTIAVAVIGIPIYLVIVAGMGVSWPVYLAFVAGLTLAAVWIAGRTDRVLKESDSRKNVIDELPGFFIALTALPCTWQIVTAAFLIERALDILKIWPASWVERTWPGGWGVVFDDVVAGLYTLAILHAAYRFAPSLLGG